MGISAKDYPPRANHADLRQQGVFNPAVTRVVVVLNSKLASKLPEQADGLGANDVLCRRKMIGNEHDPFGIPRASHLHALKLLNRNGATHIIN